MDARWLVGLIVTLVVWASRSKVTFMMFGHLFVIPVMVIILALLILVVLAMIVLLIRLMTNGGVILGRA